MGHGATLIATAGVVPFDSFDGNFVLGGAGSIVNDGRLIVAGPTAFADLTGGFTNAGSIDVGGGTLEIDANASFCNTGTVTLWGGGSTLLLDDDLSVAALGTVVGSGTIVIGGTLDNTGNTLSLAYGSPFPNLQLGEAGSGVLQGGTVVSDGGPLAAGFGVLSGVTWEGPLSLEFPADVLAVRDGVSVITPGGGPGEISITGSGDALVFLDNETLNNTDVQLGAGALFGADATLAAGGWVAAGSVTLAAGSTLDVIAPGGTAAVLAGGIVNDGLILDGDGDLTISGLTPLWPPSVSSLEPGITSAVLEAINLTGAIFDNTGTILAGAGTTLDIDSSATLHNEGLIAVSDGETMIEQPGATVVNTGTISLGAGSSLQIYQTAGNLGTIALASSDAQIIDWGQPHGLTATISEWTPGAEISVNGINNSLGFNAGTLYVIEQGTTVATLTVGNLSRSSFFLTTSGGTTTIGYDGVSWAVPSAGNWNSIDWSSNGPPQPGDDASITVAGTVSVTDAEAVNALLIDNAAAVVTLAPGGTLSVATAITLEAGTLVLDGGTLAAGSLIQSGGTIIASGATLDNLVDDFSGGAIIADAGTLTLGPGFLLTGTAAPLLIAGHDGGAVVNRGSIERSPAF